MVKEITKRNNQELINLINHESFFLGMRTDGIAYFFLKDNVEITIDLQADFVKAYNELTDGRPYPIVYEPGENCNVTKEARENAVLIEHLSPITATAIIAPSSIYQLIANFYLKFNKPKRPYKVFKKIDDAIEWLTPFVETI